MVNRALTSSQTASYVVLAYTESKVLENAKIVILKLNDREADALLG